MPQCSRIYSLISELLLTLHNSTFLRLHYFCKIYLYRCLSLGLIIDVSVFAKGVYLLEIATEDQIMRAQVIIE